MSSRETYCSEEHPEDIQCLLAPDSVRDGIQREHANDLTQGLQGTPESSVMSFECIDSFGIREADMVDKTLVGNDIP